MYSNFKKLIQGYNNCVHNIESSQAVDVLNTTNRKLAELIAHTIQTLKPGDSDPNTSRIRVKKGLGHVYH